MHYNFYGLIYVVPGLLPFHTLIMVLLKITMLANTFAVLAKNIFKDNCMATTGISVNSLYFRTQYFVIAIE
jgi:hypothetical protein